jgi:CRP-like cAMP-binding protein
MKSGLMDDPLHQRLALMDVLKMHVDSALLSAISATGGSVEKTVARLESYMKLKLHGRGTVLFDVGDPADTVYIVLSGGVASVFDLNIVAGGLQCASMCCSETSPI